MTSTRKQGTAFRLAGLTEFVNLLLTDMMSGSKSGNYNYFNVLELSEVILNVVPLPGARFL